MEHVESIELPQLYFFSQLVSLMEQIHSDGCEHIAVRENRAKLKHVRLIVQNLSLLL
jgi:hypothetical protein